MSNSHEEKYLGIAGDEISTFKTRDGNRAAWVYVPGSEGFTQCVLGENAEDVKHVVEIGEQGNALRAIRDRYAHEGFHVDFIIVNNSPIQLGDLIIVFPIEVVVSTRHPILSFRHKEQSVEMDMLYDPRVVTLDDSIPDEYRQLACFSLGATELQQLAADLSREDISIEHLTLGIKIDPHEGDYLNIRVDTGEGEIIYELHTLESSLIQTEVLDEFGNRIGYIARKNDMEEPVSIASFGKIMNGLSISSPAGLRQRKQQDEIDARRRKIYIRGTIQIHHDKMNDVIRRLDGVGFKIVLDEEDSLAA